jgi:hypothetical protein
MCHARTVLVNLDTTFAKTVWIDPVPEPVGIEEGAELAALGTTGRVVDDREGRTPGVALVVHPDGAGSWVLIVRHEPHATPPGRLIVTPDNRELVVFEGGEGAAYVVALADGTTVRTLGFALELRQALAFRKPDLLVLADELDAVAFGPDGFLWETDRLVIDRLEILGREGDRLIAVGYGLFEEWWCMDEEFEIDVATGRPAGRRPGR